MFSCEFCEISKNIFFFREHIWWLFLPLKSPENLDHFYESASIEHANSDIEHTYRSKLQLRLQQTTNVRS